MSKLSKIIPSLIALLTVCVVQAQSTAQDAELARKYAPQLRLSGPGSTGVFLTSSGYPFIDYIPMHVDELAAQAPDRTIDLELSDAIEFNGETFSAGRYAVPEGALNLIGSAPVRGASNSLIFAPLWDGEINIASGYKALSPSPTVYYRVFRDPDQVNPVAIQYWFFYFYNDWINRHPGDWESVTVFLDESEDPAEVAYLNYHEATRLSWQNVDLFDGTHPIVYVANGGHGSYAHSGTTAHEPAEQNGAVVNAFHFGDRQQLDPVEDYVLEDLAPLEANSATWVWFEGRWGNNGSDLEVGEVGASFGPQFRRDVASASQWQSANHPPFDPFKGCLPRTEGAYLYGSDQYYGPWYWASGYGLDTPWETQSDCDVIQPPQPPTDLSFSITGNVITVRWDASVSSNTAGYLVYYAEQPGNYTSSSLPGSGQALGPVEQYSVALPEATYYFVLQSYDAYGQTSELTAALVVSFDNTGNQPGVPTVIRTGALNPPGPAIVNTTQVLEWNSVPGSARYQLTLQDDTTGTVIVDLTDHPSPSYTTPALEPGHAYSWRVRSCNVNGCSSYSPYYYFQIKEPTVTSPSLVYHRVTGSRVDVYWTGSEDAAGYTAHFGFSAGNYIDQVDVGNITTAGDQVGPGNYFVALKAYNATGTASGFSEEIFIQVPQQEPAPLTPSIQNPGATVNPGPLVGSIIPTLNWLSVDGAESYRVVLTDTVTRLHVVDATVGSTNYVSPPLVRGRNYGWTVQACNAAGCSDFAESRYFRVSPNL